MKKIKLKDIEGLFINRKRNLEVTLKDWRFAITLIVIWLAILSIVIAFMI